MEKIDATTLHIELYRMAVGQPGRGTGAMERVFAICQELQDADPDPQMATQLRELQTLMADWTRPGGWQDHGHKPDSLRDPLMECIGEIVELADVDDEDLPDGFLPPPMNASRPLRLA